MCVPPASCRQAERERMANTARESEVIDRLVRCPERPARYGWRGVGSLIAWAIASHDVGFAPSTLPPIIILREQ